VWGKREALNGPTIQAEPDTEYKDDSLDDASVKAEDMWGASSVYKVYLSREVFR